MFRKLLVAGAMLKQ